MLAACSGASSPSTVDATIDAKGIVFDAGIDAGPMYSAANPPLGDEVGPSLTVAAGWSAPRYLKGLPNLDNDGGWTDSVTVSRDGNTLYFGYSKRNAFQFLFKNGNEVIDGQSLTADHNTKFLQVFEAELGPSGYQVTRSGSNPSDAIDVAAVAINEAKNIALYTIYSIDPPGRRVHLSVRSGTSWTPAGALSEPVNTAATTCDDDNPFVIGSSTAGVVFWQSKRSDTQGGACSDLGAPIRIFRAPVANGTLGSPQLVDGIASAGSKDYEASFAEDFSRAYWVKVDATSFSIRTADGDGQTYSNSSAVVSVVNFMPPYDGKIVDIGEPNVVSLPTVDVMYFRCGVARSTVAGNASDIQLKICVTKRVKP